LTNENSRNLAKIIKHYLDTNVWFLILENKLVSIIYNFDFFSHISRQAQYEHPCAPHYIYQPEVRIPLPLLPPPPPRPTHFHSHNMLVPANPYLNQGKNNFC